MLEEISKKRSPEEAILIDVRSLEEYASKHPFQIHMRPKIITLMVLDYKTARLFEYYVMSVSARSQTYLDLDLIGHHSSNQLHSLIFLLIALNNLPT